MQPSTAGPAPANVVRPGAEQPVQLVRGHPRAAAVNGGESTRLRQGALRRPGATGQFATTPHTDHIGRRRGRSRLPQLVIAITAAAAFGPYLFDGIRTEQLAVYALAATAVISGACWRINRTKGLLGITGLLLLYAIIPIITATAGGGTFVGLPQGDLLAGLDNLTLPIAALTIAATGAGWTDPPRLLATVCRVVVLAMCANAALAVLSVTQYETLVPYLAGFWDGDPTGSSSVAQRAADLGRYSGIFNQPAEAGILYGVGLLGAVYLYRRHALKFALATVTLTVGGVLSVSKAFLFVGLPIALWQAIRADARGRRILTLIPIAVAAAAVIYSGQAPQWTGGAHLDGLVHPDAGGDGLLGHLTAGRLGESGTLQFVAGPVLHSAPWFGIGARGAAVPYDNGWIESLVMAGLVGVAIHTALLATLFAVWYQRHRDYPRSASRLAGGLVLLLIGADVGLPALTANRVATIVWLLLGLLLFTPRQGWQGLPRDG